MLIDTNFKVSIFGDFANIKADSETVLLLTNELKSLEIIPSTFYEINSATGTPIPRVMLISQDNHKKIMIGSNRIDYEASSSKDEGFLPCDIDTVISNAITVFSYIMNNFKKSANRLAINTTTYLINLSSDQEKKFWDRFPMNLKFYSSSELREWSHRLATRIDTKLGDDNETLNVITVLSKDRIQMDKDGVVKDLTGFSILFDINTIRESNNLRFGEIQLSDFLKHSSSTRNEILIQINEGLDEKSTSN